MSYVSRGDFGAHDFYIGDYTKDGQWHDLDLSELVPEGTEVIHVRIEHKANVDDTLVKYRQKGYTGEYNCLCNKSPVKNVWDYEEGFVVCDEDRKIQYVVPSSATGCTFMVRGWFI